MTSFTGRGYVGSCIKLLKDCLALAMLMSREARVVLVFPLVASLLQGRKCKIKTCSSVSSEGKSAEGPERATIAIGSRPYRKVSRPLGSRGREGVRKKKVLEGGCKLRRNEKG